MKRGEDIGKSEGEEARNITHSKRPNEASGRVSTRRGKQVELDRDWEKRLGEKTGNGNFCCPGANLSL